jgi:RimJ/RimL family protein N-acetyltransferase
MARPKAPEIQTKRLLLRELTLLDAATMYSYRKDPEVMRYQTWHPASEQEVEAFIKRINRIGFGVADTWFQMGIYLKDTQELIGDVGIHFLPAENSQAEIGFTVSPKHQRKGYASEAVGHLLDYLFKNLRKHRVVASVDPRNLSSTKLLEGLGMHKEGHFRQSIWTSNGWADDAIYALLETEWNKKA